MGLVVLVLGTAAAYLWNLSESGYANSFYAAAVQAGTKSWKAFFFGSLDSSNFITVDKPPASLWVMALSGRIFGFSSWSMLAPQALEGVAAVALLYASVKRRFGAGPGLLAGALFAMTPVAALMFRFNNPDALLVLLLVASAYCLTRAIERAGTRWILACGALIGFAFLAKMLQAFLVLPAFALVYLIAAPTGLRQRIGQLLAGGAALVLSAGWWVAIVALWPTGSRPFIDGSPDDNIFNLITGYNGLGRLSGGTGGVGAGNFSGATGLLRLFNDLMGAQASWLLPAALVAVVVGLWARRRTPRTDEARAALLLWGGWLVVTAIVFSFAQGVIHTYYTVALAPAIAALVAISAALWWPHRNELRGRGLAALVLGATATWSYALLDRAPSWEPWLRPAILISAIVAVLGLLAAPGFRRLHHRVWAAALALGVAAALAGPVAYAAQTIGTAHTGSIPSAGPATSGVGGIAGGGDGAFPSGHGGTHGRGGFPISGGGTLPSGHGGFPPSGRSGRSAAGAPRGSGGGGQAQASTALIKALEQNASHYRWVAAVSGSQSAASLELATGGDPVMAIGGFNNNGGLLTLSQFKRYVAAGDIHYYIAGGDQGGPGGSGSTSAITQWVEQHFKSETVGGQTVYDLTQAKS
ncbi:MAG TPA: glycosyltransferase family 39 protein [Solirubrobacteraceae bacterium]|nr:glycosyltransferase family 39 protein [Solirubrobacteraceae bacterium]